MVHFYRRYGLLLMAFMATAALYGGAWTPEQGKVYLKLSANQFKSSSNFTVNGDVFDPFDGFEDRYSKFRDRNYQLYLEYGVSDRFALISSLTYKEIEQRTKLPNLEVGADNRGFADFELGGRYRLTEGPHIVSLAILAKLPFLYDDDEDFFALGSAQEDYEFRLLYGRSLGAGFYGGLEAGYRFRTEEPSDEYRYLAELGWGKGRFYTRTKYEGILAKDDFVQTSSNFGNPLLNPRYDLETWLVTVGLSLSPRWHVEASFTDTLAGKNTANGHNQQLAVVFSF